MAASGQDKTEKPTGKRLSKARQQGQIPKSRELASVAVLFVGGLTAFFNSKNIYTHFSQLIRELWAGGFGVAAGRTPDSSVFIRIIYHYFAMFGPIVAACMVAALVINIIQVKGIIFSFAAIRPKFSKLNPIPGFSKFFSTTSLIELAKSILKLLIIGYSVYLILHSEKDVLMSLSDMEVADIMKVFGNLAYRIFMRVVEIMVVLGILDFIYQRWKFMKDMKMTKQEVKDEAKQSENPEIKSRIRSIQFSMHRKRMMANVPKASVVITNPTHFAVALKYAPGMEAPQVVAKGANYLALKIIEVARKSRVPVVQNPPLARALYRQVEVEDTIPVDLYKAVAKVLAYIYQQKRQRPA